MPFPAPRAGLPAEVCVSVTTLVSRVIGAVTRPAREAVAPALPGA